MDNKITVGIVDDESLLVSLLSGFINKSDDFIVTLTAEGGKEYLDKLKKAESIPEISIVDLRMKEMDGVDLASKLRTKFPDMKIITLSSHYNDASLGFMLRTGVSAFIPKELSPDKFYDVLKSVHTAGFYLSADQIDVLRTQVSSNVPRPSTKDSDEITPREIDVLKLICQQYSNTEIADMLNISIRTVEGHRNNLYLKTNTKNIAGLVIFALKNGLVNINECTSL